ncbi:MAG: hypothetical protein M0R06_05240 [Sphaerochaeta sp.]|jgi:hypothetical protein|nr:hypothetical protein [Sphaerochaeta sp.]
MAAEFKPPDLKVEDIITLVGAAAGVYVNDPTNLYMIKLALTQAQLEICDLQRWHWLRSVGHFVYSANASTLNMYSVSTGKYRAFGGFETLRLGRTSRLTELDSQEYADRQLGVSTSSYPDGYMRIGEASLKWQPVPTARHSVHFVFNKRAGFVQGNEDLIIPQRWVLNTLVPLARNKVWEMKGDPRSGLPNSTYEKGVRAMKQDEPKPVTAGGPRPWYPRDTPNYDPIYHYSGMYCTGVPH